MFVIYLLNVLLFASGTIPTFKIMYAGPPLLPAACGHLRFGNSFGFALQQHSFCLLAT